MALLPINSKFENSSAPGLTSRLVPFFKVGKCQVIKCKILNCFIKVSIIVLKTTVLCELLEIAFNLLIFKGSLLNYLFPRIDPVPDYLNNVKTGLFLHFACR
jgi:hypothetical protein